MGQNAKGSRRVNVFRFTLISGLWPASHSCRRWANSGSERAAKYGSYFGFGRLRASIRRLAGNLNRDVEPCRVVGEVAISKRALLHHFLEG
jgi:hypothetical protein